ncbi:MAG: ABC transporter substrate-binding protein [Bacteroidales bacterium]|nr:ABC transporter substrate-binding protein [Bacteroidales bacterium]
MTFAERFRLNRHDGYTRLTILNPWQGASGVNQTWYLVRRGEEIPEGIDQQSIIYVPIRKIICMSSTHLAMAIALNEEASVIGVSGAGFLYETALVNRYEEGLIRDVGYDDNLNKEMIVNLTPDLVMAYGVGGESSGYLGKIRELGIKVLVNADYLETDPLGKAEWLKLFGALYCRETLADSIFDSIAGEYHLVRDFIRDNSTERPAVLLGLPFRDTWFISPGNSYISRMITDAGGNYLWSETNSAATIPMGIENVYLRALKADYWLNPGSANSVNDILAIDMRLKDLPCFRNGNIYNNNKRTNDRGANDYWESGTVKPHLLLKDMVTILHPELFSESDLLYYRKID